MTNDILERAARAMEGITEGPWTADAPREFAGVKWDNIIRGARRDPICTVFVAGYMAKEAKSNARFIAAAPGLVRDLMAEIERLRMGGKDGG